MAAASARQSHLSPPVRRPLFLRSPLLLLALASAAPLLSGCGGPRPNVTFRFRQPIGVVDSVSVAGSFNGWNSRANPLADDDYDGLWEARLRVPPGRIEYKFVVNHKLWFTDWTAEDFVPDGFDGVNSVATVGDHPVTLGFTSVLASPPKPRGSGWREKTFTFRPATKPDSVKLACFFNPWTPVLVLMRDERGDGTYLASMRLPPGKWPIAFVVNGYTWNWDTLGQGENRGETTGRAP